MLMAHSSQLMYSPGDVLGGDGVEVRAEMVANVWQVATEVGNEAAVGDELVILESMKMEIPVVAPIAGTVTALHVAPEQIVQEGDLLATVEPQP